MRKGIYPVFGCLLALACLCSTALATDVNMLTMSGGKLSAEEAAGLEGKLERDPDDMDARAKLLGYYMRRAFRDPAAREAKQESVLWLIENAPESEVLSIPAGQLNPGLDGDAYARGKRLWTEALEDDPENPAILGNSAKFFLMHDRALAESSLLKAKSLDPENPEWPQSLGQLYSLGMMTFSAKTKRDAAKKALEEYEAAYDLSTEMWRGAMLQQLAKTAIEAEELEKAEKYARKMLASEGRGWNSGNNVHHGNNVLGRIALRSGDVETARKHLIAAGRTSGSPQLDSIGPNMSLAKELLEKGEKEAVLEFFDLCSRFWKMDRGRLKAWAATVKQGGIPDFGANLAY
jgi:tetratricopeptide (TPR) repeat protein